jgi:hypothetical protein
MKKQLPEHVYLLMDATEVGVPTVDNPKKFMYVPPASKYERRQSHHVMAHTVSFPTCGSGEAGVGNCC